MTDLLITPHEEVDVTGSQPSLYNKVAVLGGEPTAEEWAKLQSQGYTGYEYVSDYDERETYSPPDDAIRVSLPSRRVVGWVFVISFVITIAYLTNQYLLEMMK